METVYHFFKEDKANAVLLVIACLLLCFLLYKVAGIKIRFNKKEPRTIFHGVRLSVLHIIIR